jgi:signal transduction histidine kinase
VGRLFERFWRKESARGGGGEHVGLGLSLAHMFAVAMGWRLTAALGADGWLVFSLETCGQ